MWVSAIMRATGLTVPSGSGSRSVRLDAAGSFLPEASAIPAKTRRPHGNGNGVNGPPGQRAEAGLRRSFLREAPSVHRPFIVFWWYQLFSHKFIPYEPDA